MHTCSSTSEALYLDNMVQQQELHTYLSGDSRQERWTILLQFCCKFTSVYVRQKLSKYNAVGQSYCKKVQFLSASHCVGLLYVKCGCWCERHIHVYVNRGLLTLADNECDSEIYYVSTLNRYEALIEGRHLQIRDERRRPLFYRIANKITALFWKKRRRVPHKASKTILYN